MKKAICLAVVVVMMTAMAGVASAENKIGVGYVFQGSDRALSLVGELSLSEKIAFGFDYIGWDPSSTELLGKLTLQNVGSGSLGVFGGVELVQGATNNTFKIGAFGQQAISPEIAMYGRAGMAFQSSASNSWVEALGGLKADVMAPFWLSGEVLYSGATGAGSGTAFRVMVGMNF